MKFLDSVLFFTLGLGLAACGPALASQRQTSVMSASSAMPTSDISLFSHEFHVQQAGFGCVDCHNSLFQQAGSSANAAGDFTLSAFEQGKYCGTCHDGSTAFAATDQGSCARCHGSGVTLPKTVVFEQPVKAVFDHGKHADEFSLPCSSCHDNLFKMKQGESEKQPDFTMEAMQQGKYCGACHDGASAFSLKTRCAVCHVGEQGDKRLPGTEEKRSRSGHAGVPQHEAARHSRR